MLSDKMVITNGRDRFGYVRHVRYIGEQAGNGEDVYRVMETGRLCVRQKVCEDLVRWCTATKWSGGYEADTPFKDGLMPIDRLLQGSYLAAGGFVISYGGGALGAIRR